MTPFSVRGHLLLDRQLIPGALTVGDGRITQIVRGENAEVFPEPVIESVIVSPGLIDLQVNGGLGLEVGEDAHAFEHLARELPSTGVTGFLATAVSSPPGFYPRLYAACEAAADAPVRGYSASISRDHFCRRYGPARTVRRLSNTPIQP